MRKRDDKRNLTAEMSWLLKIAEVSKTVENKKWWN